MKNESKKKSHINTYWKEDELPPLGEDEEYVTNKRKVYPERLSRFDRVIPFNQKTTRKFKMDLLDLITSVSKSAAILFNQLKENTDPTTNIATMTSFTELTDTQMRPINRKLAELKKATLAIKLPPTITIPSEHEDLKSITLSYNAYSYMINPHIIYPRNYNKGDYNIQRAQQIWDIIILEKEE